MKGLHFRFFGVQAKVLRHQRNGNAAYAVNYGSTI
jgi:hypothetical protein